MLIQGCQILIFCHILFRFLFFLRKQALETLFKSLFHSLPNPISLGPRNNILNLVFITLEHFYAFTITIYIHKYHNLLIHFPVDELLSGFQLFTAINIPVNVHLGASSVALGAARTGQQYRCAQLSPKVGA